MIFLLKKLSSRSHDSADLSSSGREKTNTYPKGQRGGFGEIPKTFLSPNGYPNHHLSTASYAVGAIRSNHTAKATFKCSTSENKISSENKFQISKYQLTSTNLFASPVKIRNKFQSQSNHDSFNCRPSKSNPHSINQKISDIRHA